MKMAHNMYLKKTLYISICTYQIELKCVIFFKAYKLDKGTFWEDYKII